MNARYQLLQYVPHALLADAVTIGAVVRVKGKSTLVLPEKVRNLGGIGGENADAVVTEAVARLIKAGADAATPNKLGPFFNLSEERDAPHQELEAAANWLRHLLDSAFRRSAQKGKRTTTSRLARSRREFLKPRGISEMVKRKFNPRKEWQTTKLGNYAGLLKPVSQWAGSGSSVLLLEPIDVDLDTFDDELEKVGTELMAYNNAILHARVKHGPELVAYVLGGSRNGARQAAYQALRDFAEVIDITREADAGHLADRIRRASEVRLTAN